MSGSEAAAIAAFLERAGWSRARRTAIPGDASFRRYERLEGGDGTAILMIAPPPREDVRPFMAVDRLLRDFGFHAPDILAADAPAGLLLLEDFGDDSFNRVIARRPELEPELYETAIDLLVDLHRHPAPASLAVYDAGVLLREARLYSEWYLPPVAPGMAAGSDLDPLWNDLFAPDLVRPEVLVQRDYHADNLMWLPGACGHARIGLLDFQDALAGHRAYDLVSLLQDARRDVPPALENAMIARYLAATGVPEAAFLRAYWRLGAQRAAKIIGIFSRLARRDGKPRYLAMIPRVQGLLGRCLASGAGDPGLDALAATLDRLLPPDRRRDVPELREDR